MCANVQAQHFCGLSWSDAIVRSRLSYYRVGRDAGRDTPEKNDDKDGAAFAGKRRTARLPFGQQERDNALCTIEKRRPVVTWTRSWKHTTVPTARSSIITAHLMAAYDSARYHGGLIIAVHRDEIMVRRRDGERTPCRCRRRLRATRSCTGTPATCCRRRRILYRHRKTGSSACHHYWPSRGRSRQMFFLHPVRRQHETRWPYGRTRIGGWFFCLANWFPILHRCPLQALQTNSWRCRRRNEGRPVPMSLVMYIRRYPFPPPTITTTAKHAVRQYFATLYNI